MAKKSRARNWFGEKGIRLKALNDTKLVLNEHEWPLNHLGSIWFYTEPSNFPYSPNQFLDLDFFYCFLQQGCSNTLSPHWKKWCLAYVTTFLKQINSRLNGIKCGVTGIRTGYCHSILWPKKDNTTASKM